MRRVAIVVTAALVALMSCFIKPDRPGGSRDGGMSDATGGRDGGLDGKLDAPDDALSGCGVHDDFDDSSGPVCGAWGTATTATALARKGSVLVVAPSAPGAQAYCETTLPFNFDVGASIEIPQAMASVDGDRTFVSLLFATSQPFTLSLAGDGSGSAGGEADATIIEVYCSGAGGYVRPYDPKTDRWVRFTGSAGSLDTVITLETGSNGTDWTYLTDCTVNEVVQTVKLRMGAGLGSGFSAVTETHFDNFNIKTCPPL